MTSFGKGAVLRPVHASLLLSFAALVAGCSDAQRKQPLDTTPAATGKPVAAATHTTSRKRPPRPTKPCSFVAGPGGCLGLLAGSVPTVAELTGAGVLVPALGGPRQPSNLVVHTFVNKDARNIDLDQLPNGQSLLIGSMVFAPGAAPDIYYHTSGGGGSDVKGRTAWIVLSGPTPGTPATNGLTVSTWSMYGIDPVTKDVKLIGGPKNVVECTNDSPYNGVQGPNSYFSACQAVDRVHALAHELKRPFDAVLAYVACRPDQEGHCTVPQPNDSQAFTAMSVSQRDTLLKAIKLLTLDPTADAYWFSCGQGCCTAE